MITIEKGDGIIEIVMIYYQTEMIYELSSDMNELYAISLRKTEE